MRSPWLVVLTTAVAGLLVLVALQAPAQTQDLQALWVAGRLWTEGAVGDLYPRLDGDTLHAVSPRFREVADTADGVPALVTGFVSPPLVLPLCAALGALPWWLARRLVQGGVAVIGLAALHHLGRSVPPERRLAWAPVGVSAGLLVAFGVAIGQTSPLWLAGLVAMGAGRSGGRGLGAGALALLASLKIVPGLSLLGAALAPRGRAAAVALGILIVLGLVSLAWEPATWGLWLEHVRGLSGRVATYWNNASVDAAVSRLLLPPPPTLRPAPSVLWTLPLRLSLLLGAGGLAWRRADRRAEAATVAALALTPLLWVHYLVVLPVLLRDHLHGSRARALRAACWMSLLGLAVYLGLLLPESRPVVAVAVPLLAGATLVDVLLVALRAPPDGNAVEPAARGAPAQGAR